MPEYNPVHGLLREPRVFCSVSDKLNYCLKPDEHIVFAKYFDDHDITPLSEIIRENKTITDDFRRFIADVMIGCFKKPRGKKTTTHVRDFEIYHQITQLLESDPTLKLRSNQKRDGAAMLVSNKFKGVTEDAALKAYRKIQQYIRQLKSMENHRDECT